MTQHSSTTRSTRRSNGLAATALAGVLVVSVAACGQDGQDTGAPSAAGTSVAPTSQAMTESAPQDAATTASETASETAQAYWQARAAGDADAAWALLSPLSRQAYGDQAAYAEQVQLSAPGFADVMAAEPSTAVVPRQPSTVGSIVTAYGLSDPDTTPQAFAVPLVLDQDGKVDETPTGTGPAATLQNPDPAQGGSLGVAFLDEGAPVSVALDPAASVASISVDGALLEVTPGADGAYTAALPALEPGLHAVTVTYGGEGEPLSQSVAAVFETAPAR